jgi:hypothetical protein
VARRERRKQLYAEAESGLWLASAGGRKLSIPGIKTMISRLVLRGIGVDSLEVSL